MAQEFADYFHWDTAAPSPAYFDPTGYGVELGNKSTTPKQSASPPTPNFPKSPVKAAGTLETAPSPAPVDAVAIIKQVDATFANVDNVLRSAGSKNGWDDVYLVRAFVVNKNAQESAVVKGTVESLKKWYGEKRPLLTFVEVKGLALSNMMIEVEVEAKEG